MPFVTGYGLGLALRYVPLVSDERAYRPAELEYLFPYRYRLPRSREFVGKSPMSWFAHAVAYQLDVTP